MPTKTNNMLILTVGYPASGKSHLARQLAEDLNICRVSADRIRYELFENPQYSRDEDAIVFSIFDYMLEELLKAGQSVICDGDFSLRKSRRLKYELARTYNMKPVAIWVQTDIETARMRSQTRDGRKTDDKYSPNMDQDIFDRLLQKFKAPQNEPVIVVSGKHAYKAQRKNIFNKLHKAGYIQLTQAAKPTTTTQATAPAPKPEQGVIPRKPTNRVIPRNQQPLRVNQ